jgi:DNA-binding LacI/PurR family transcriptional regulator
MTVAVQSPIRLSPRQRATRGLRELIDRGLVKPGDRLPAEETLAEQFAVSRATLRMAMAQLERDGHLKRQRNHGCVVTAKPRGGGLMDQTIALISDLRVADSPRIFSGLSEAVHSGAIDMAGRCSMNLLSLHSLDEEVVENLVASRPRGVVVTRWQHDLTDGALLARLAAGGIPLVAYGDGPHVEQFDRVVSDHVQGAYDLTKALIAAGRRRILRLWSGPAGASWIRDHNIGCERAFAEADIEVIAPVHVAELPARRPEAREQFDRRVRTFAGHLVEHVRGQTPIDAIMLGTDCDIFPVAAACRLHGVADRIAITGYDNYWTDAFERQWEPATPFASVDKNNHRIGEELVRLLLDRLNGQLPAEAQVRTIEQRVEQVWGESRNETW